MPRKWYVVTVGKEVGVFDDWLTTAPLVKGVYGAVWQGFEDEEVAYRRFDEESAKGNVKVVRTGQALRQEISRSSSVTLVGSNHAVNLPARSRTMPHIGSGHGSGYVGINVGAQVATPPQSPRSLPVQSRTLNSVGHASSEDRGSRRSSRTSRHRLHVRPQREQHENAAPTRSVVGPHSNHIGPESIGRAPRGYEHRNTASTPQDYGRSLLLQSVSASVIRNTVSEPHAAPRAAYDTPTSISGHILRRRSSSSTSSVSTRSAVTCPESPLSSTTSISSLVEPLGSEDSGPTYPYPVPRVDRTRTTPAAPRRASPAPTPDHLALDMSRVTIRPGDQRLEAYVSSPVASRTRNGSAQPPLLSPLYLPEALTSERRSLTAAARERGQSTPAQTSRMPDYSRRLPIDRANLPVYSVHGSDSEPEEDRTIPVSRASTRTAESEAKRKRQAYATALWASLGPSATHVQNDVHDASFDPRSPIRRGTRVPRDTTDSMFSRPSPQAPFGLEEPSSSVFVR